MKFTNLSIKTWYMITLNSEVTSYPFTLDIAKMYLLAYEEINQRQFTPVNQEIIGVNWRDMKCAPYNWNIDHQEFGGNPPLEMELLTMIG